MKIYCAIWGTYWKLENAKSLWDSSWNCSRALGKILCPIFELLTIAPLRLSIWKYMVNVRYGLCPTIYPVQCGNLVLPLQPVFYYLFSSEHTSFHVTGWCTSEKKTSRAVLYFGSHNLPKWRGKKTFQPYIQWYLSCAEIQEHCSIRSWRILCLRLVLKHRQQLQLFSCASRVISQRHVILSLPKIWNAALRSSSPMKVKWNSVAFDSVKL